MTKRIKTRSFKLEFIIPELHQLVPSIPSKNPPEFMCITDFLLLSVQARLTAPFQKNISLSTKPFEVISSVLSYAFDKEKRFHIITISCVIDRPLRTRNETPFSIEYFFRGKVYTVNPTLVNVPLIIGTKNMVSKK